MSSFSDLFGSGSSDTLPDWLRQGANLVDEGFDLYDRIAGGSDEPDPGPMRTQTAAPASPFGLTPMVALIGGVVLLYLFLGISRRP